MAVGHALESPSGCMKDGPLNVVPMGKQGAKQVRSEETTGAEDQHGALKAANLLSQGGLCHDVTLDSLRIEGRSRPHICR